MQALSGYLIHQLAVDSPDSLASAVGLVLITLATNAWIAPTTEGFLRGQPFARGSAAETQVLQGAVGLSGNPRLFARPDIAGGLFVSALVALALLQLSPAVCMHLGTTGNSD